MCAWSGRPAQACLSVPGAGDGPDDVRACDAHQAIHDVYMCTERWGCEACAVVGVAGGERTPRGPVQGDAKESVGGRFVARHSRR